MTCGAGVPLCALVASIVYEPVVVSPLSGAFRVKMWKFEQAVGLDGVKRNSQSSPGPLSPTAPVVLQEPMAPVAVDAVEQMGESSAQIPLPPLSMLSRLNCVLSKMMSTLAPDVVSVAAVAMLIGTTTRTTDANVVVDGVPRVSSPPTPVVAVAACVLLHEERSAVAVRPSPVSIASAR